VYGQRRAEWWGTRCPTPSCSVARDGGDADRPAGGVGPLRHRIRCPPNTTSPRARAEPSRVGTPRFRRRLQARGGAGGRSAPHGTRGILPFPAVGAPRPSRSRATPVGRVPRMRERRRTTAGRRPPADR
jgi:hypothetical protein